eukprot:TRINITY_DN2961_c0_g1_i6.p1 TRINITY_DN2961_c0_g1~~TRINITY_DN2961_c0_g1_i6.p1  ORF type:complete len:213 (+),score=-29.00 TRINITY_DN2961_c0_g1_i6:602-1240(+)
MMMWENWPIFWWDVVLQISINSTKVSLLLFIYQLFVLNIICQLGKIFVVINICKIYVFYTIIIIFFFKSEQIRFIFIDLPIVLYKYYIYIKLRRFFSQNKFQYGIFLGYNKFENYNKFEFWGLEQFGGRGLAEYLFIQELKIQERVIDLINIIINILILSLQINGQTMKRMILVFRCVVFFSVIVFHTVCLEFIFGIILIRSMPILFSLSTS